MMDCKKILFLGGKPIGSIEMVKSLKDRGFYVVVADYLPAAESPAKLIADEQWDVSTADVDTLKTKAIESGITGIMTGVHEFNINRMLDLCDALKLPCYCTRETWKYCDNKIEFKHLCSVNSVPVSPVFIPEYIKKNNVYPIIVKPVDGSGSRGFHICNNYEEFNKYYPLAAEFSPSASVLIEKYIPYDAVIIHYTMVDGKCIYSGMSDKVSVKFKSTGASVMGIQTFPSAGENAYLNSIDEKVRRMFENAGFIDGPIWIEAFYDGDETFIFNEMGYRFGGSLTYFPVKYFTGIDQLSLMIDNASSGKVNSVIKNNYIIPEKKYCILPIHIKVGKISFIQESKELHQNENIKAIVPVHYLGDEIKDWGSAQQVYAYLHLLYTDKSDLKKNIEFVLDNLKVMDSENHNMLHTLFDISTL